LQRYKGKVPGSGAKKRRVVSRESLRTHLACAAVEDRRMMMNLLAGFAVWMLAALGLGLTIGLAMNGYAVRELPARPQLAGSDTTPSYPQAA
jgi:hypothetical protein